MRPSLKKFKLPNIIEKRPLNCRNASVQATCNMKGRARENEHLVKYTRIYDIFIAGPTDFMPNRYTEM